MEVTLQHIASELNVSVQTVSRSLRHDTAISPETRARVHEVARRMGYTSRVRRPRRPIKQNLKNNGTLGLLVRFPNFSAAQHDSNLMKMLAGIMSVTDEQNMNLQTYTRHSREPWPIDTDPDFFPPVIKDGECQALIAHGEHSERDLTFLANRMPVICIGRVYENLSLDAAVAQNVQGVSSLVTHLAGLGHRRLAWVGAHYAASFMEEREAGFLKGCRKHGLELASQLFFGQETYEGHDICDKAALLAAVTNGVTGFVCGSDGIASRIINILEESGRRVPEEVSVVGFDAWLEMTNMGHITSIDPNFVEIGKAAARLALQRMAHPMDGTRIVSVPSKIVLGNTTASPPTLL